MGPVSPGAPRDCDRGPATARGLCLRGGETFTRISLRTAVPDGVMIAPRSAPSPCGARRPADRSRLTVVVCHATAVAGFVASTIVRNTRYLLRPGDPQVRCSTIRCTQRLSETRRRGADVPAATRSGRIRGRTGAGRAAGPGLLALDAQCEAAYGRRERCAGAGTTAAAQSLEEFVQTLNNSLTP